MKKIIVLVLLISSFSVYSQQSKGFKRVLRQHKADKVLIKKLKRFASQGIEKPLPVKEFDIESIIDTAETYKGTRHCMGGITHRCIDCSGLLYISFKHNGINLPHSSQGIARYGKIIANMDNLKRGDLVFFVGTYKTKKLITHSGIYLGDGQFIHTSAKRGVVISNLKSKYYRDHFIFGTRLFPKKD